MPDNIVTYKTINESLIATFFSFKVFFKHIPISDFFINEGVKVDQKIWREDL